MTESGDRGARPGGVAGLAGGVAAGLVAGLFGVGGGVLLVPLLTLALRRPQHVAHATSLVAVTLAAVAGLGRFALGGAVSWLGGAAVAAGAVVGAHLGARWAPRVAERRLRQAFALLLLVVAARFLLAGSSEAAGTGAPDLGVALTLGHVAGGVVAGVVSSLLGVGGGIINVPLLAVVFGYGQQIAEGTSLAVIVPTALVGAWGHHRSGFTDWGLGLRIGGGAVAGSVLGASLALGLPADVLARLFGVLQAVIGVLILRGRAGG